MEGSPDHSGAAAANSTEPDTPLALSHHRPEQYDRCVLVGGRHLCRRCLTLYPLAFIVAGLSLAGLIWPHRLDPVVLLVLPLPAVIDWWLEHLDRIGYDPRRQILVTIPAALALGQGLARYLDNAADPLFWGMVLIYGGSCLAVAIWRFLDDNAL